MHSVLALKCLGVKAGAVPVSILYKSIAGSYRPVRVADGPITARYRFIKNASWGVLVRTVLLCKIGLDF